MQSYNQEENSILVQALSTLKTKAKDDKGKTYLLSSNEEVADGFKRKHNLEIKPSVIVTKNVKRKDLVIALLNHEIIEVL